jgi:hypothetical protein
MSKFQEWLNENYPASHVFHGDPILDPYGRNVKPNPNDQTTLWPANGPKPQTQAGNTDPTQIHRQAPQMSSPSRLESIEKQLSEIKEMLNKMLPNMQPAVQPLSQVNKQPLPMARRV